MQDWAKEILRGIVTEVESGHANEEHLIYRPKYLSGWWSANFLSVEPLVVEALTGKSKLIEREASYELLRIHKNAY